jgi:hypothetical protein
MLVPVKRKKCCYNYISFQITFKDDKCDTACKMEYTKETVKGEKLNFIKNGIRLNYQHHW